MNLGPTELIIILLILLVLFGASRLRGLGGALGGSIREFKSAVREDEPTTTTTTTATPPVLKEPVVTRTETVEKIETTDRKI